MARKKRTLRSFKKAALQPKEQHQVKGGRKASPAGPGFHGSSIWEGIDIRSQLFSRKVAGLSSSDLGNG